LQVRKTHPLASNKANIDPVIRAYLFAHSGKQFRGKSEGGTSAYQHQGTVPNKMSSGILHVIPNLVGA
jgi:hypothetical protein